jgi:hypothetical protein
MNPRGKKGGGLTTEEARPEGWEKGRMGSGCSRVAVVMPDIVG